MPTRTSGVASKTRCFVPLTTSAMWLAIPPRTPWRGQLVWQQTPLPSQGRQDQKVSPEPEPCRSKTLIIFMVIPQTVEEGALIQRPMLDSSVFALLAVITSVVIEYGIKLLFFPLGSLFAYPSVKSSIRSGVSDRVPSSSAATFVDNANNTTIVSRCSFASVHSIILTSLLLCTWSLQYTLALNAGTSSRTFSAMAALTEDGEMYTWGDSNYGGGTKMEKVRAVYSTVGASTVLTEEGSATSFGGHFSIDIGGTAPRNLANVQSISSTTRAFAALTTQGTVVAWGDSSYGGTAPSGLTNVRTIFSNHYAFAAVLENGGKVVVWGYAPYGGGTSDTENSIGVPANLANVKTIYSNMYAMAALKEDGTVQAWGYKQWGGAGVPANLTDVIAIYAAGMAFAALREDGTVQAWGEGGSGGAGVPSDLTHVTAIYSTFFAFCAHLSDGRVRVWGSPGDGGSQPSNLDVVSSISSSYRAFAALTEHGTVIAWGNAPYGGSMTDVTIDDVLYTGVPAGLKDVRALYSNYNAFAALMEDGTVQAWGNQRRGGKLTPAGLKGVQSIFASKHAFAALKKDGTVFAWGDPTFGGSMTDGQDAIYGRYTGVPSGLKNVKTIFGDTQYFADSTAAQLLPCPHNTYGPGFPDCTACPQGSKQPVGRPGIRSKVWSCIDCDRSEGKFSIDGRTCDFSCAYGHFAIPYNWYGSITRLEGDMCFTCLPGSYFADGDCKLCPLGRYQDTKGQYTCKDCASGKYTRAGQGSTKCSACPRSKTVLPGKGYASSDCFKICPQGQYGSTGSDECLPCRAGTYNNLTSGTDSCTPCEAGKAQPLTNQSSCSLCAAGKWANTRGATECFECPPGSSCGEMGMSDPEPCPVGRYTNAKERQSCIPCPAGRYQNSTGSAMCDMCPRGTYLPAISSLSKSGANSSASCLLCPPGTFSDTNGLGECTQCPTGQVQPNEGQVSCDDCSLEGKIKTNNEANTACIDNPALLSSSVVEIMFTKGVALSLSFAIAAAFALLAKGMNFMKSKHAAAEELGTVAPHVVVLKSVLPGFSLGSEIFLIVGILSEEPALGAAMLTFRLLHPVATMALCFGMFLPNYIGSGYLREMMRKASLHVEFMKSSIPLVGVMLLACMGDVTMIQFMPFKRSQFHTESKGYPSVEILKFCLGVKTLQAMVSMVCQLIYVTQKSDIDSPTTNIQAKILFSLSIAFSLTSFVMGLVMFFLKGTLLGEEDASDKDKEDQTGEVKLGMEHELQHITFTENPMIAAGSTSNTEGSQRVSDVESVQGEVERNPSRDAEVTQLRTENDQLRKKNQQLSLEVARLKCNEERNDALSHPSSHSQGPTQQLPSPPADGSPQTKQFPTFFGWLQQRTTGLFPDRR